MRRVIKLVLPVKPEIFKPTIKAYTIGYNYVCQYGFENKQFNNLRLHHETYRTIREYLPSDLAITARTRAYGTLKALKYKIKLGQCDVPVSKEMAIQYTKNGYSINLEQRIFSCVTTEGRVKIPLPFIPQHFLKYLTWKWGAAEILVRGNKVFLNINVEKKQEEQTCSNVVVGLDRGINNIAVLSNNKFYTGKSVKLKTQKLRRIKAKLQSAGTKSAKRHLKKLSKRENRFRKDVNHCISKQIINDLPAGSTLVLEDLSGINCKERKKLGKRFNKQLNSWAYYQLEQFLTYKAEEKNINIVKVDPSYTSQQCSSCGHIERKNRKGSRFHCCSCGFQLNADLNASRNIQQNWLSQHECESRATLSVSLSSQQGKTSVRDKPMALTS